MKNPLLIRHENGKLVYSRVPREDLRNTLRDTCERTLAKRFGAQEAKDIAQDMTEILFEMCCHLDGFYRAVYEEQEGE